METKIKYSKSEAIEATNDFLKKVSELEKEFGLSINSDTGDIYISYKTKIGKPYWDTVKIGWKGDGTGLKVTEVIKDKEFFRQQGLAKLNEDEIKALGLKK